MLRPGVSTDAYAMADLMRVEVLSVVAQAEEPDATAACEGS